MTYILTTIFMSVAFAALHSCGNYKPGTDVANTNTVQSGRDQPTSTSNDLTVPGGTIEFHGWWWSTDQMGGNFNADNPPPKNSYLKLERWDTSSDNDYPHPDRVDVLCTIENKGTRHTDFVVIATGDFKVASFKRIQNYNGDKTPDQLLVEVPWTDKTAIGQLVANDLAPGEKRVVKFRDFNLRAAIDKHSPLYNDSDLWTWKMRVQIVINTSNGARVDKFEAILDIIPAD